MQIKSSADERSQPVTADSGAAAVSQRKIGEVIKTGRFVERSLKYSTELHHKSDIASSINFKHIRKRGGGTSDLNKNDR